MSNPEREDDNSPILAKLIKSSLLPVFEHTPGGTLRVIHGDESGMGEVSLLLSYNPPGGGPPGHLHPYVELFVVQSGRGIYFVGDKEFEAGPGDVVVVPPDAPHRFECISDDPLMHVAVHQSAHSVTRWLT